MPNPETDSYQGRAWKFGNDVDTDLIIPARRLTTADPEELAKFCMEDADPTWVGRIAKGDIIVAGKNFGCGSSREHAPMAIKAAGIACVVAESFARIFYRNSVNIGLPIFESVDAARAIEQGHDVRVEPATGTLMDLTTGGKWQAAPFPPFMRAIMAAGGLAPYTRARLGLS